MTKAAVPIAALLVLTGAAAKPAMVIENARVRPPAGGLGTTAAYMTLRNTGDRPDRLLSAACACAAQVSLHQSLSQNGVSRMVELKAVDIPAKGQVAFDAAGRHLMLMGLKGPLKAGDKATIVLTFEHAGQVPVVFAADPMAGMGGMGGMEHHHHP